LKSSRSRQKTSTNFIPISLKETDERTKNSTKIALASQDKQSK